MPNTKSEAFTAPPTHYLHPEDSVFARTSRLKKCDGRIFALVPSPLPQTKLGKDWKPPAEVTADTAQGTRPSQRSHQRRAFTAPPTPYTIHPLPSSNPPSHAPRGCRRGRVRGPGRGGRRAGRRGTRRGRWPRCAPPRLGSHVARRQGVKGPALGESRRLSRPCGAGLGSDTFSNNKERTGRG